MFSSQLVTLLKMGFQSLDLLAMRFLIAMVQGDIEGKISRQLSLLPKCQLMWHETCSFMFRTVICMYQQLHKISAVIFVFIFECTKSRNVFLQDFPWMVNSVPDLMDACKKILII